MVMEQDLSETETEELIAKLDDELVETPTIDDENVDLPALLGLRSIREKKGVIETSPGHRPGLFRGPGFCRPGPR